MKRIIEFLFPVAVDQIKEQARQEFVKDIFYKQQQKNGDINLIYESPGGGVYKIEVKFVK